MNVKLIKMTTDYKDQLADMIDEWKADIEKNHTCHSPWVIFRADYHDFDRYLSGLEITEEKDGRIPDSTFFCLDTDRNVLVGAVNIRHYLTMDNCVTGGHIGDGIRPSERRKGYASAMIGLALKECRKLGINKVLMTCDADNIGSEKSIINNGGIFESLVEDDGEPEKRFWINLYDEVIETERMILKRATPFDYADMAAWTMDERVYRYLLGNPCKKPEDALPFLQRNDPNSKTHYVMIERSKADGHAIGIVAIRYEKEDDCWEVSYNAGYDDWGKGYTTEGIKAMIDYVVKNHGAHTIKGECAKENIQSARVLEKAGMKFHHDSSYTKHDGRRTFASSVYQMDII